MSIAQIRSLNGREILDSKGRPTIEVDVRTNDGSFGRGSAPCGSSVGSHEAFVLVDCDRRFMGLGVQKAIRNVEEIIAPALIGMDVTQQKEIDTLMIELDQSPNKTHLGANATYSVSIAVARAAASSLNMPFHRYLGGEKANILPIPMFNMINGGWYGNKRIEFQEFLLLPTMAQTYAEALRMGVEVFYQLSDVISKRFGEQHIRTGNSAGFVVPENDPSAIVETLLAAVGEAGYEGEFKVGLDCAASHFYDKAEGKYSFKGNKVTREEIIQYLEELGNAHPIFMIEDPLDEDDFDGFATMTKHMNILICGDDLFATRIDRLEKGYRLGAGNGVMLKPNMVGTITEALEVARWAEEHEFVLVPSIRSGSTVDDPIADISVAVGAPLIKPGAPRSGERTACHNQLVRIEENLNGAARFQSFESLEQRVGVRTTAAPRGRSEQQRNHQRV